MIKRVGRPKGSKNKKTKQSYSLKGKSKRKTQKAKKRRGGKYANILASGNLTSKKINLLFFSKKSKTGKKQIAKKFGKSFLVKLLKSK